MIETNTPDPDALENIFDNATSDAAASASADRRAILQAENEIAKKYWGSFQPRIVLTFLAFAIGWGVVLYLGLTGAISLWVGLVLNTFFAATFYMPMHEAVHKNIWGKETRARWGEDFIGKMCSIPLLIPFGSHRGGHMRHHAYTNDSSRDPDHFSDGTKRELLVKMLGITMVNMFLPFFALVPKVRVVLPKSMLGIFDIAGGSKKEGLAQVRFWLITHVVLIGSMFFGLGWQALALWYIPARLQFAYLIFIFAWYPHHPAGETTRYRHTRVAVFRGSGLIIRGHDHHAMHHMFPRVPHYRLRALWNDVAQDMVAKGVRAEGRATAATTPVVW